MVCRGAVPDEQMLVRDGEEFLTYAHCLELATLLATSSVLVLQRSSSAVPLVRVHSCCTTGDLFGSERCDCGDQLRTAINVIARRGAGMLVYDASHEGRGIGLLGKMLAYALQSRGADTYAANATLGFPDDLREFGFAEAVIDAFYADQAIHLLTNNPTKLERIADVVRTVLRVPIHGTITSSNEDYLRAKHANGHLLALDASRGTQLPALGSPAFRARRRPHASRALEVDAPSD